VEGEVTLIVVDAEEPGEIVREVEAKVQVQPGGQEGLKLNVEVPHAELSLLVTLTV